MAAARYQHAPQRHEDVYVVGAVQKPGAYPFIPDFTALDYVGLAGSTENAGGISRTNVVRRGSHNKLDAKAPVEAGDIVFVPRRVEFGIREITSIVATITNILVNGEDVEDILRELATVATKLPDHQAILKPLLQRLFAADEFSSSRRKKLNLAAKPPADYRVWADRPVTSFPRRTTL